jgi:Mn2+/Fe2+ NRAMP family transporter
MVATAASLPLSVTPLVLLMNDGDVLSKYANGWVANIVLFAIAILSVVVFVAAVPLQILGGS